MGLNEVKKEILTIAEKKADNIIDDAKKKESEIIDIARKKVEEFKNKKNEDFSVMLEQMRKREISQANLTIKKDKIKAKKEIIEEAFLDAKKQIEKFSDSKRKSLIQSLWKKAYSVSKIKSGKIYCSKKDLSFLKAPGFKIVTKNMLGGLIVESNDETVTLDYSYDTMLDDIRSKDLQKVAAILF